MLIILVFFILCEIVARRIINKQPSIPVFPKPTNVTYKNIGKKGRLGNQMFELAASYVACIKAGPSCTLILSPSIRETKLLAFFPNLRRFEIKELKNTIDLREYSAFDPIVIPQDGKNYNVRGYRQDWKYIEGYENQVKELFRLSFIICPLPFRYIAMHIRRSDYLNIWGGLSVCELNYYKKGLEQIYLLDPASREWPVIVCTDDRKWVKEHLNELSKNSNLSHAHVSGELSDFYTLKNAQFCVIANSTFSWWAAFLGKSTQVIVPSVWFKKNHLFSWLTFHGNHWQLPNWITLNPQTGIQEITKDCGREAYRSSVVALIKSSFT